MKGRGHLGELGIDEKVILKELLNIFCVRHDWVHVV
jgi:hypothetical protein